MNKKPSIIALNMGEDFKKLASLLQRAHTGKLQLDGPVEVSRGNYLAHFICNIFRFPKAGHNIPLRVDCEHTSETMSWERDFDGLKMVSYFTQDEAFLVEYLGPLTLRFKAIEKNAQLHYQFEKTHLFGVPIPKVCGPQITAFEKESGGDYAFFVEVRMFLIGKVISYQGTLKMTSRE